MIYIRDRGYNLKAAITIEGSTLLRRFPRLSEPVSRQVRVNSSFELRWNKDHSLLNGRLDLDPWIPIFSRERSSNTIN